MMSDLVKNIKQLRDYSEGPTSLWGPICYAAADMLERQQERIEELEARIENADKVLQERETATAPIPGMKKSKDIEWLYEYFHANLREARAALQENNDGN